jgi:hypothetical protein
MLFISIAGLNKEFFFDPRRIDRTRLVLGAASDQLCLTARLKKTNKINCQPTLSTTTKAKYEFILTALGACFDCRRCEWVRNAELGDQHKLFQVEFAVNTL